MDNVVTVMGSGHGITPEKPVWLHVENPTAAQVAGAVRVAETKIYNRDTKKWSWSLLYDHVPSWKPNWQDYHTHPENFKSDIGRHVVKKTADQKPEHDHARPGRGERSRMRDYGRKIIHSFMEGMEGNDFVRARDIQAIASVINAVEYGDLPAAVNIALTCSLPKSERDRLVGMFDEELKHWPDFQRTKSTTEDETIPHHVPASLTISASVTQGVAT